LANLLEDNLLLSEGGPDAAGHENDETDLSNPDEQETVKKANQQRIKEAATWFP
jgi:hypothetical protein